MRNTHARLRGVPDNTTHYMLCFLLDIRQYKYECTKYKKSGVEIEDRDHILKSTYFFFPFGISRSNTKQKHESL